MFYVVEKRKGAREGSLGVMVVSGEGLGDGPGAEVAGVGDVAEVVGAAADGEAVDVDAVAVPVVGDEEDDFLVGAFLGLGEEALAGLGVVDEEVGVVVGIGADDRGAVGQGDGDLEGVFEGGGAELDLGEVSAGDLELVVVDGGGAGGGGMDVVPVGADEDVALGGASAASYPSETQTNGREEGGRKTVDGTETGADEELGLAVGITNLAFVAAHHRLAFPKGTDYGSDFSDESVKDSLLYFSHNFAIL